MILGVVSDTHNRLSNIEKIIDIFNSNKVDFVIHTGDITKAETLRKFSNLNCSLIGVYGNNDLLELGLNKTSEECGFDFREPPFITSICKKKIAIFHEPETIAETIENDPSIDLVLHGHTHRYTNQEINGVKIFNPGECAGMIAGKNAVGIIDLDTLKAKRIFF